MTHQKDSYDYQQHDHHDGRLLDPIIASLFFCRHGWSLWILKFNRGRSTLAQGRMILKGRDTGDIRLYIVMGTGKTDTCHDMFKGNGRRKIVTCQCNIGDLKPSSQLLATLGLLVLGTTGVLFWDLVKAIHGTSTTQGSRSHFPTVVTGMGHDIPQIHLVAGGGFTPCYGCGRRRGGGEEGTTITPHGSATIPTKDSLELKIGRFGTTMTTQTNVLSIFTTLRIQLPPKMATRSSKKVPSFCGCSSHDYRIGSLGEQKKGCCRCRHPKA